ncbi:hypothetical protein CAEBREN_09401 [Caenorhabditis brenneri]|uniref:Uncharacterized protein n=1 Tax=Caenorhabditis brenneri TaxID=135651 RepID=G0M9E7_CAEBE|nr:hypothetical protein CAEBREN_09401 [Caenorhabditis brenneri]
MREEAYIFFNRYNEPLRSILIFLALNYDSFSITVNIPAATGMILSAIQLFLFIVFPRTKEDLSPLEKLAHWFTGRNRDQQLENTSEKSSSNTLSIASLKI